MAFLPGKENHSLKHISADSPKELEELMLQISIESLYPVNFATPVFYISKWITWYNYDWSKELHQSKSEQPKKSRKNK